jgi:heme A synthase
MKQILKNWTTALLFAMVAGGLVTTAIVPQSVLAAPKVPCDQVKFLTIPAWYRGIATDEGDNCNINSPDPNNPGKFIWTIVLNITEIMLHLVGYITIAFIIYGGFKYMLSAGSSDGITKAKSTIMNALIGLVLSIVSIAIINVVSGVIQ